MLLKDDLIFYVCSSLIKQVHIGRISHAAKLLQFPIYFCNFEGNEIETSHLLSVETTQT